MENSNSKPKKKSFSIFCCFSTNDKGRRKKRKNKQEENNKLQPEEKSIANIQQNATVKEISNSNNNEKFKNEKNKIYGKFEIPLNENNNSRILSPKQNISNTLIINNIINISNVDLKKITTYKSDDINFKAISTNIEDKKLSIINNKDNNNISAKKEENNNNIGNLSEIKSNKNINNIHSEKDFPLKELNENNNNIKPFDNNTNNNLTNKNMSLNHKGTQSFTQSDINKMNLYNSNKNNNIIIKNQMLSNDELNHKLNKSQFLNNDNDINIGEYNNNIFVEVTNNKDNNNSDYNNNKTNRYKNKDIYLSNIIAFDKAKSSILPSFEQSNISIENNKNFSTVYITQDAKVNNNFYFSKPNKNTQKNTAIIKNNSKSQKSLGLDKVSNCSKKLNKDKESNNENLRKSFISDIENINKKYFHKTDKNLAPFQLNISINENNIKKYSSDVEPQLNYINNTLVTHDNRINNNLMNKIATMNNDITESEDDKKENKENNNLLNKNSNNNIIIEEDNNISESANKNSKSIDSNKKSSHEILIIKESKSNINDTQIQDAYENINCMEEEIEDEMGETDEINKNINDTRSIVSSYVKNYPSVHENSVSLNRESLINFNEFIQNKITIMDDTEIEITNENVKNFKNFIETPRASGVYNKGYNTCIGYNNISPNKVNSFFNSNQILMREIEKLFQEINKNEDFINKTNEKINDIQGKMNAYEEWNKKYDSWIEKEEKESEVLIHMLNFLNKNKK